MLFSLNGPREIPGCTGPCQLTYCRTCYFDDQLHSPPANCSSEECGVDNLQDYLSDSTCFRRWGICVRRNQVFRPKVSCSHEHAHNELRLHNKICIVKLSHGLYNFILHYIATCTVMYNYSKFAHMSM